MIMVVLKANQTGFFNWICRVEKDDCLVRSAVNHRLSALVEQTVKISWQVYYLPKNPAQ